MLASACAELRVMRFVDTRRIEPHERGPGRKGRTFHSPGMTFAHWEFTAGSDIHERHHPQEEVRQVIEGELRVTVGGETQVAGPGMVAIAPANTPHSLVALTDGRAIVTDWPVRRD
jgi:quercetin dioxygenase-like cupin family protein